MRAILSLLSASALLFAFSAHAGELEYRGYMRAPVGSNFEGGKQISITNPGSSGNEFRLGNEGGYGEAYFTQHFVKPTDKTAPFFDANLTFAYNPSMNSQYADTTATGDNFMLVEAYAKGGNYDNVPASFWAGKRFYRDGDIHMDDFFYFANMSGNGGGMEDYVVDNGKLSLAFLQYTDDRTVNKSTIGHPTKHALDFRWRDFKVSDLDKLELWLAEGYTPPGTATTVVTPTQVNSQAAAGTAAGLKWTHALTQGNNDFAVVYGTGVMESLNLDKTAFASDDTVKNRKRFRVVENYFTEVGDKWAVQAAAIYETADNGTGTNNKSTWANAGVRPMYYFTDHFRIQGELGFSSIKNEAETGAPERTLTRVTLSPEVTFGKGYYTRPVVRFYVTHSMWNDANKDLTNTNSLVGKLNAANFVALNNKTSEDQFGFQTEVWF